MLVVVYCRVVPKLWNETIDAHRREVRDAILDTTAALVFEHGLRAVTMSQVAEHTGIGRATLYKYFPDMDAILHAWHARQIDAHLRLLTETSDAPGDPGQRLAAVLTAYARIAATARSHDTEMIKFLHPEQQVLDAQQRLRAIVERLIADDAAAGRVRADISPAELANYCLNALTAATVLTTDAEIDRLVDLTLDALRRRG
ncbi:TetR/AcrR family transcriptional regulator [Skermania sp. ID1734]|uniref:TetR/AcrR family transcriptional regulator n=1 Tax=Skermania sp. ID1734 TaxID=2597516 RepID=UPI00117C19E0|nr:TetR/AcrR family transcriptional regulator [Skermania sp. ID1734]TSD93769.1 TetR/AcrR family transcriptional regulator [Skermania sp. ID1734]